MPSGHMWDLNPSFSLQRKCASRYTTWPIKTDMSYLLTDALNR